LLNECLHELDDDISLARQINECINDKQLMKKLAVRNFEKAKEYHFDLLRDKRNAFLREFKEYCEGKMQEK